MLEDGYSSSYAIVEGGLGIIREEAISDIQFITTANIGTTHMLGQECWRYGTKDYAEYYISSRAEWFKSSKVTNYTLYSQKDKYIPF